MPTLRENIVANALWGLANEPRIHYTMGSSRFNALHRPRQLPLYTDCSAFVTLCYAWAGAPDPNGRGYDGYGFTGTLIGNLPQIPMSQAKIGDLITYGPGNADHVVMIVETGADPLVVSHGQEAGPLKTRHSTQVRTHRSPVRVLKGLSDSVTQNPQPPGSVPVPTPIVEDTMKPSITFTNPFVDIEAGEEKETISLRFNELSGDIFNKNFIDNKQWWKFPRLEDRKGVRPDSYPSGLFEPDGTLHISIWGKDGNEWHLSRYSDDHPDEKLRGTWSDWWTDGVKPY